MIDLACAYITDGFAGRTVRDEAIRGIVRYAHARLIMWSSL